jgi:hypothetical protein
MSKNKNRNDRNVRTARFWAAFGSRMIDAGFAGAASLLVKAFLARTADAAVLDVFAGFVVFAFFIVGGHYAFARGGWSDDSD